jgi:hypothetical protein
LIPGTAQSDRFQTDFISQTSAAMMTRKSEAEWLGGLIDSKEPVKFGSGSYDGPYRFKSRFESGTKTNPEELIAAKADVLGDIGEAKTSI